MVCSGNPTTNLSRIYALRRVPPGQIPEPLLPGLADLALATVLVTDVTDVMVRREESCAKYAVEVAQDTTRHWRILQFIHVHNCSIDGSRWKGWVIRRTQSCSCSWQCNWWRWMIKDRICKACANHGNCRTEAGNTVQHVVKRFNIFQYYSFI